MIKYEEILLIISLIIPGFFALEISNKINSKGRYKGEKDKLYISILASLFIMFISSGKIGATDLKENLNTLFFVKLMVISLIVGIVWGYIKEHCSQILYDYLNKNFFTKFSGDEPIWDTTFREMHIIKNGKEQKRFLDIFLKNGEVISGTILQISTAPYEEGILIEPNAFWLCKNNNEMRKTNSITTPTLTSDPQDLSYYKSILIYRSEISKICFDLTDEEKMNRK